MGAAARHRRAFLADNPRCIFCGGNADATSIEHCPPRSMFQFRLWPEGFEFPSCEQCNQGTGDYDLLVAMLARMDPFELKGNRDGKQIGLMLAANKQFPGLIKKMMPSASEARRHNRAFGITPAPGQTHQEVSPVNVPREFHHAVCVLAIKLAKGIYYREKRSAFPNEGCLLLSWFTNTEILRKGRFVVFDLLKDIAGTAPILHRGHAYLNDQFEYKLSISAEKGLFALQAKFGNAFGFVVFGSALPGKLESIIERLREQSQRNGILAVLQSPTLPVSWFPLNETL